jgi:hypothetical protein
MPTYKTVAIVSTKAGQRIQVNQGADAQADAVHLVISAGFGAAPLTREEARELGAALIAAAP